MAEVVTRGIGEHEVIADQAELRVAFAAEAADRSGAVNLLSERTAAVNALLERAPVAAAVQVRHRSMSTGDRWDRKRRVGASAHLELVLQTTELGMLADLVAELVSAEPMRLDGPHWSLADHASAMDEALRRAVADARSRAEAYAAAAGLRLGPLLRLGDEGGAERPYPFGGEYRMAAAAGAVSGDAITVLGLNPMPITVRATCTASWSLLD